MNVDAEPAAFDDLARLGIRLVPAVAVGDRAAHGWNPPAYAALLGIAYTPDAQLDPRTLAARLDRILRSTQTLVERVPDTLITWTPPERNRTIRQLGYHVFRLAAAFVDGMELGEFPEGWLQELAPADLADGRAIARYGASVRARLTAWFAGTPDQAYARVIQVYYGPQSGHDLLERTTWHAAQHLRQLYVLADRIGVVPPEPLPTDALTGLPLPESLW